jgi:hypothetical protein
LKTKKIALVFHQGRHIAKKGIGEFLGLTVFLGVDRLQLLFA